MTEEELQAYLDSLDSVPVFTAEPRRAYSLRELANILLVSVPCIQHAERSAMRKLCVRLAELEKQ